MAEVQTSICLLTISSGTKESHDLPADLIHTILRRTPEAAGTRHGNGSLPLHAICHERIEFTTKTKEVTIKELVVACKIALIEQSGHFESHSSPQLSHRYAYIVVV